MIEEGPKVPGRACSLEGILVLPLDGLILADTTGVIQMDPDLSQNIFLSQARSHGRRDVSMLLLCSIFQLLAKSYSMEFDTFPCRVYSFHVYRNEPRRGSCGSSQSRESWIKTGGNGDAGHGMWYCLLWKVTSPL